MRVVGHDHSMTYRSLLARRLEHEWNRLRVDPTAIAHAETWGLVNAPIITLDEVLTAIGQGRPSTDDADANLRYLVILAASDPLAARVVIQRILPGLVSHVGRRDRWSRGDPVDELVGAAWVAVRTFNPDRRPACLAAALIADADHRAFRAPARRRSSTEIPIDHVTAATVAAPDHRDDWIELAALAREAALSDDDAELIRQLVTQPTAADAARALRVSTRTIRNRRARLANQLREVAGLSPLGVG